MGQLNELSPKERKLVEPPKLPTNGDIVSYLLQIEGWPKYTDDPIDMGGPTKGGITLNTLRAVPGHENATKDDLRNLPELTAREIYLGMYIVDPDFYRIEDGLLRWQVVDAGVLHGPVRAVKWLQEALGLPVDGVIGPVTVGHANELFAHGTALRFAAIRLRYMAKIVHDKPKQVKWIDGWVARATRFIEMEATR